MGAAYRNHNPEAAALRNSIEGGRWLVLLRGGYVEFATFGF
jgi:hypothetical protein